MAMAKFPDPTKNYTAEPIEKPIDAAHLETEQYAPPPQQEPPAPPPFQPPTAPQMPQVPYQPSPFRNLVPLILGLLGFLVIIFLVVKFVLPLFGSKQPENITLTYWGLWEPPSVVQTAISDYERLNPNVKINYVMQSPKNYRTRLQNAITQGVEAPDIARIHNTWLPMLAKDLTPAPSGVVAATDISLYYPIVSQNFVKADKVYALPLMIDGLVLFYNEDILSSVGAQPPADWNELRQLAYQLTTRNSETGVITRAGVAMGTANNIEHWSDILGLLMLQNSANPSKASSQQVQDALTFYTIFSTQDKVWDSSQPSSVAAFASGSVAMILAPSWQAHEIKALNPALKFKTVSTPRLGGTNLAWATYWGESVTRSSQHPDEAWKFIKFLSSQETLQKLYASASQIRSFGEPYPLQSLASLIQTDPIVSAVVNQGPNYTSWYLASRTHDEGLNDEMIKYYEDAVNAINEGSSVLNVVKTLDSGVQQVLSRYPGTL